MSTSLSSCPVVTGTAGAGTSVGGVHRPLCCLLMLWSRPLPVLRQALRQKHQEAQQACRPHNLPVLQAAQQRELEVEVWAGWAPAGLC